MRFDQGWRNRRLRERGFRENRSTASGERTWTFSPVLESGWNDQLLNLRAILPGVAEKDVRVSVQNNQLVIEGERKVPEGFDKNAFTQLATANSTLH